MYKVHPLPRQKSSPAPHRSLPLIVGRSDTTKQSEVEFPGLLPTLTAFSYLRPVTTACTIARPRGYRLELCCWAGPNRA